MPAQGELRAYESIEASYYNPVPVQELVATMLAPKTCFPATMGAM